MMHLRGFRKVAFVLFLLGFPQLSNAKVYEEFSCPAGQKVITEPGSEYSISRKIPAEWLLADQKGTGTCYAYTAAKLVQFHHWERLGEDADPAQVPDFSPSLLACKSRNKIENGGNTYLSLQDLKEDSYKAESFCSPSAMDGKAVSMLRSDWQGIADLAIKYGNGVLSKSLERALREDELPKFASSLFSLYEKRDQALEEEFKKEFAEVVMRWAEEKNPVLSNDVLELFSTTSQFSGAKKIVKLAPYNIYVNTLKETEDTEKTIRDYFQSNPASYPLEMSFASSKEGWHSVVVTGFKRKCCEGSPAPCEPVISVVNSYGGRDSGEFLLKNFNRKPPMFTYLRPCAEGGASGLPGGLEACVSGIKGNLSVWNQLKSAFRNQNIGSLKRLAEEGDSPQFRKDFLNMLLIHYMDSRADGLGLEDFLKKIPHFEGHKLTAAAAEMGEQYIQENLFEFLLVGSIREDYKLIDFISRSKPFYTDFQQAIDGLRKEYSEYISEKPVSFGWTKPDKQAKSIADLIRAGLLYQNQELIEYLWTKERGEIQHFVRLNSKQFDERTWTWLLSIGQQKKGNGLFQYFSTKRREEAKEKTERAKKKTEKPKKKNAEKPAYDSLPPLNEKRMQGEDSSLFQELTRETDDGPSKQRKE